MSDIDRLRLARTEGVGPVTYRRLMARFTTAAEALRALPDLTRTAGRATPPTIPTERKALKELEAVASLGGQILFIGGEDYPPMMALLPDPPPVLSILGNVTALHGRAIGIVGARNASANGARMAEALASDLAAHDLIVVSGMARGIDAAAHTGALHVGLTVAATAGGLDHPYPPEHTELQARIAERGCVVTEAPLGTAPQSRHFPRRNRIIAGLSLGLVVIEAALKSGSLITARLAQDANRELFAVPGHPLDPRSRGTNNLIRQGAHLTESAEDVLANLPDDPRRAGLARNPLFAEPMPDGFSEELDLWDEPPDPDFDLKLASSRLLALLSPSPTELDELVRRAQLPAPQVMAALMNLELALEIEFIPGNRVVRL